jgi:hypothetical protein
MAYSPKTGLILIGVLMQFDAIHSGPATETVPDPELAISP